MRLHHVQVACAPGGEDAARRFYVDGLGLTEVAKPEALRDRGGAWFRQYDGQEIVAELHVGVEDPFRPARKAHPAFIVIDQRRLADLGRRLVGLGFEVDWSERDTFPGHERFHTVDGSGNRVELLAPV
ncbi:VOC family protein [Nocardioides sp.]|uniref:VOC family protein n=1 Tax=Nocardioides sp. TaxID=35761 RepID=UPI003D0D2699